MPTQPIGSERSLREVSKQDGGAPTAAREPGQLDRLGDDEERVLVCRACRAPVSRADFAIAMDGAHQHTFFNPAGVTYEIGCFSAAPGCAQVGPPTAEFAWFAGYRWCYALCRSCDVLLGWYFTGRGNGFWGLIVNRLDEAKRGVTE